MNQTRLILVSIMGLGIALIGIGGYYLVEYYLFLQNCNGGLCPIFDGMRNAGRFTLSIGVVISAVGILGLLTLERDTSNQLAEPAGQQVGKNSL